MNTWKRPTAITGSENRRRKETTVAIQANTGILIRVIPGARIVSTVVMKLTEDNTEARPSTCKPSAQ